MSCCLYQVQRSLALVVLSGLKLALFAFIEVMLGLISGCPGDGNCLCHK